MSCVGWGLIGVGELPRSSMHSNKIKPSPCWFNTALLNTDATKCLRMRIIYRLLWLECYLMGHSSISGCIWAPCIEMGIPIVELSVHTWKNRATCRAASRFPCGYPLLFTKKSPLHQMGDKVFMSYFALKFPLSCRYKRDCSKAHLPQVKFWCSVLPWYVFVPATILSPCLSLTSLASSGKCSGSRHLWKSALKVVMIPSEASAFKFTARYVRLFHTTFQ